MKRRAPYLLLLVVATAAIAAGAWALIHFSVLKRQALPQSDVSIQPNERGADPDLWARSMEKVKKDRAETEKVALEIPPELRHYEDRHWFLATQVAEVRKHNLETCQDFADVATMLQRSEMVPVPAVTDDYVLFGVGAKADDGAFQIYEDDRAIPLYDE